MENKKNDNLLNFMKRHRPNIPQASKKEWENISKETNQITRTLRPKILKTIKNLFSIKIFIPAFAFSLALLLIFNMPNSTQQNLTISDNEIESLFSDTYGYVYDESQDLTNQDYYTEFL